MGPSTDGSSSWRAFLIVLLLVSLAGAGLSRPDTAGAATASWSFEPQSFDFGVRLPAEGPTGAKAFELRNTGEVPLTPALVSISGEGGSGFAMTADGCNHTIAPGTGCTIEVTFGPRSGGRKEGTLSVESSGHVVAAATARLSGSGGEPLVVIEPAAVTFDTVTIPIKALPHAAPVRTVTITNASSTDLHIRGAGYAQSPPVGIVADFGVLGTDTCRLATIPPGGSCAIPFVFDPRRTGAYRAELKLEDDAPDSPQPIVLNGTAVAETPPPSPVPPVEATLPRLRRAPPRRTTSRTAIFAFGAASSPGGFECRTGSNRPFSPCTSPVRLTGLTPGLHLFQVRGVGSAGHPGDIESYSWRVLRRDRTRADRVRTANGCLLDVDRPGEVALGHILALQRCVQVKSMFEICPAQSENVEETVNCGFPTVRSTHAWTRVRGKQRPTSVMAS